MPAPNAANETNLFGQDVTLASFDEFEKALSDAYASVGRTLDDLPYTSDFDRICAFALPLAPGKTPRDCFHKLANLRKAGKLVRVGRATSSAVKVTPEDEKLLTTLVAQHIGSLGQRDQLPYDPRLSTVAQAFAAQTGRDIQMHDLWRLIAKLAK